MSDVEEDDIYPIAISMDRATLIMSDASELPVTELFDELGEDTDDWDRAVSLCAGEGKTWYDALIRAFERTLH